MYVDCRYVSWRTTSEAFIRRTIEHEGQAGEEGEIIMMIIVMMIMIIMVMMRIMRVVVSLFLNI
jgi:hypothetical protein